MKRPAGVLLSLLLLSVIATACHKKPPVANAPPPLAPFPNAGATSTAPPPPTRPPDPPPIPEDASIRATSLNTWDDKPLELINGPDSPLKPVFFRLDSDELDDAARRVLSANAELLKQYRTWVITVEGHCDERGTAEYNLALGDRRAEAARNFLVSLGIPADRLRTVSYGSEFPFDPAHSESAWATNRRAHFMVTSK